MQHRFDFWVIILPAASRCCSWGGSLAQYMWLWVSWTSAWCQAMWVIRLTDARNAAQWMRKIVTKEVLVKVQAPNKNVWKLVVSTVWQTSVARTVLPKGRLVFTKIGQNHAILPQRQVVLLTLWQSGVANPLTTQWRRVKQRLTDARNAAQWMRKIVTKEVLVKVQAPNKNVWKLVVSTVWQTSVARTVLPKGRLVFTKIGQNHAILPQRQVVLLTLWQSGVANPLTTQWRRVKQRLKDQKAPFSYGPWWLRGHLLWFQWVFQPTFTFQRLPCGPQMLPSIVERKDNWINWTEHSKTVSRAAVASQLLKHRRTRMVCWHKLHWKQLEDQSFGALQFGMLANSWRTMWVPWKSTVRITLFT